MEVDECETPQKFNSTMLSANSQGARQGQKLADGNNCNNINVSLVATPSSKMSSYKKSLNPRTPSGPHSHSGGGGSSSSSFGASSSSTGFHILCASVVNTPPAKRFHVRNPFEAALAERLHLPLIASPSLFQQPMTPQMSSTQFEWTIEDFSSLKPANVEPHETQFQDSPDPEYEAKAQSAISSYFKEQQIVPSPIDCPLRNQRIILAELNANTPISKPGRRIRDCGTQTELSLPINLPKELEEALRPYFQPQFVDSADEANKMSNYSKTNGNAFASEGKDVSLRRKLFDLNNIIIQDCCTTTPLSAQKWSSSSSNSSPHSVTTLPAEYTAIVGKLSDSLDKSSVGSLSPITASDDLGLSPRSPTNENSLKDHKTRLQKYLNDLEESENFSPIHPPARSVLVHTKSFKNSSNYKNCKENYRQNISATPGEQTFNDFVADVEGNNEKFTPDRSSSPLRCLESTELSTIDHSFNVKVSRLVVNSDKCGFSAKKSSQTLNHNSSNDLEYFALEDNNAIDDTLDDDDDMQVSQLSMQSSNCSSSNSDTPRSRGRSASRKNLSQSFSASNWLDEAEEEAEEECDRNDGLAKIDLSKFNDIVKNEQSAMKASAENIFKMQHQQQYSNIPKSETNAVFYRTDSGFNEMPSSNSCSNSAFQHAVGFECGSNDVVRVAEGDLQDAGGGVVCCSTPSTKAAKSLTLAGSI